MAEQHDETMGPENNETTSETPPTENVAAFSSNEAALGETTLAADPTPETVEDEAPAEQFSVNAAALATAEDEASAEAPAEASAEAPAEASAEAPAEASAEAEAEATFPIDSEADVPTEEDATIKATTDEAGDLPIVSGGPLQDTTGTPDALKTGEAAAVTTPKSEAEAEAAVEAAGMEAVSEGRASATVEVTDEGEVVAAESEAGEGSKKRKRSKKGGNGRKGRKLDSFQPGEEVQGTVRSIQPYGAFIDVGAERDGLVHISELRDGFVEKVEDVVKEGDEVTVRVKEVDVEKGRLSLTMRSGEAVAADQGKEGRLRLRDLSEGQEILGKVNSIVDFGAFVDIGATTDGLVHISEISEDRINRVSDVLQEGQEVKVRVLSVDRKRNRVSLTMREHVAAGDYTYEDEDVEEMPSMMELAFARAQERGNRKGGKKGKKSKAKGSREDDDTIADIIARTLEQHKD